MRDLDAELSALVPDPPWRPPPPIPEIGDADLDAAIGLLERMGVDFDAKVAEARARVAASKHADVDGALLLAIDRAAQGYVPFVWRELQLPPMSDELRLRARTRYKEAQIAWSNRAALFARIAYLLEPRMSDALRDRMLACIDDATTPFEAKTALAGSLVGQRFAGLVYGGHRFSAEGVAPTRHLEALARHLSEDDPLVAFAAEALFLLDPARARSRIGTAITAPSVIASIGMRLVGRVDFDGEPEWVALFGPMLRESTLICLALHGRLTTARTSAPLLAALAFADTEPVFADLLARLRTLDEPSAVAPLKAIAERLPDVKGKFARSRSSVLSLAKRLARKRDTPVLAESASMGTDGGPVLVLPKSAASKWRDADYERACHAQKGGVFVIDVAGVETLVLPAQQCGFAALPRGCVLLFAGSEQMLELALADKSAITKRGSWKLGESAVVLLDPAYTLESAPGDAKAEVALPEGTYAIEEIVAELSAGGVHAVRLVRKTPARTSRTE